MNTDQSTTSKWEKPGKLSQLRQKKLAKFNIFYRKITNMLCYIKDP